MKNRTLVWRNIYKENRDVSNQSAWCKIDLRRLGRVLRSVLTF